MTDEIQAIRDSYQRKKTGGALSVEGGHWLADSFAWLVNILVLFAVCMGFTALAGVIPSKITPSTKISDSKDLAISSANKATVQFDKILKNQVAEVKAFGDSASPETKAFTGKLEQHLENEWRQVKEVSPNVLPKKTQLGRASKHTTWPEPKSDGLQALE